MSVSVFEHTGLSGLFGDPETQLLFSADAQLEHMLTFERALINALEAIKRIDAPTAAAARIAFEAFEPDWDRLREGVARDGVIVPSLVQQLRGTLSAPDAIHAGATSQDVIDTATAMTLREVARLFDTRLTKVLERLEALLGRYGERQIMGRTRMQAALPISAAHRIESWMSPLTDAKSRCAAVTSEIAVLSLGGPVGDGEVFGGAHSDLAAQMSVELALSVPDPATHTDRGRLVRFGDWLSHLSGGLGKLGQDIALMAQQGIDEIVLNAGGRSSAMAHKRNPVLAELLVTLARFNAAQVAALHGTLVFEQERSGSAWALEWMVLPQMATATGRGLTAALDLLDQIAEIAPRA